jgi:hypothetical protein
MRRPIHTRIDVAALAKEPIPSPIRPKLPVKKPTAISETPIATMNAVDKAEIRPT